MKHSEPEWDDGLRRGPFRSQTWTPELAAGVRGRIAEGTAAHSKMLRGAAWITSLAVCVAAAVLVLVGPWEARDDGPRTAAVIEGGSVSAVVLPVIPGDRPALPVRQPSDSQWQDLIEQTYPQQQTSILRKQVVNEDTMLIFARKILEVDGYRSASLTVYEFVWGTAGWKGRATLGYHPGENLLEASDLGLLTGWGGFSLDPADDAQYVMLFYGVVANPSITSVRVIDNQQRVHSASLHNAGDGHLYWFAALPPGERGGYTVEGSAADGKLVYEEFLYSR